MKTEAKMVAQAGSLPYRRLAVGGAPICNRLRIWRINGVIKIAKTNFSRVRVAQLLQFSLHRNSLNINAVVPSRAKS
jgi:hypothetical protein